MSQPAPIAATGSKSAVERPIGFATAALCVLFLLFMTGGITRLLAGGASDDEAMASSEGYVGVQLMAIFLYAAMSVLLVTHWSRVRSEFLAGLPLWIPVVFAVASVAWSYDSALTLRRVIALAGTTLGGIVVISLLGTRKFAIMLAYVLAVVVGVSALFALALPSFGQHVSDSTLGWSALHAGRWRGLYWHKNQLGPIASMCFGFWYLLSPTWQKWSPKNLVVMTLSIVTVLFAGSAQAEIQLGLPFVAVLFADNRFRRFRTFSLIIILFISIIIGLFHDDIFSFLSSLVGRDADFSGRTEIWDIILNTRSVDPIIGGGYGAGFTGGLADIINTVIYQEMKNAHNGFLQQYVDLGLFGIVTLGIVILLYLFRLVFCIKSNSPISTFGLYFYMFYLTTNMVDNYALRSQDIYWFLMSSFIAVMANRSAPVDARGEPCEQPPRRSARISAIQGNALR